MCGRYARSSSRDVIAHEFGIAEVTNVDLHPRYNVAPSQTVATIIRDGEETRLGPMRWGFEAGFKTAMAPINARAETVVRRQHRPSLRRT